MKERKKERKKEDPPLKENEFLEVKERMEEGETSM